MYEDIQIESENIQGGSGARGDFVQGGPHGGVVQRGQRRGVARRADLLVDHQGARDPRLSLHRILLIDKYSFTCRLTTLQLTIMFFSDPLVKRHCTSPSRRLLHAAVHHHPRHRCGGAKDVTRFKLNSVVRRK